jgi:glucosamine 6-phosphate synthetase-like amidotransferase/phosphosugar isomerase protein
MCGIFGSKDFKEFKALYNLNQSRGDAAFGGILPKEVFFNKCKSIRGVKMSGCINLDTDYARSDSEFFESVGMFSQYYLGHTQAPTSAAQTFNKNTSHPFMQGSWVVAHNGVLTNYEELIQDLDPKTYNIVDSSVIPALLHNEHSDNKEEDVILNVLGKLKGTFSLWIYNIDSSNLYISRCGSTLFADPINKSFSSLQYADMVEVADGTLLKQKDDFFVPVGKFNSNSPFFIL